MLTHTEVGTDASSFGLADGRLRTTTHTHGDDEPSTVTWDSTGSRPVSVTSAEGPVDFVYDKDAVLTQVRYGDDETVRTVRHEDGRATADDAAGALLEDLFDERGRFCERYFKSIFVAHALGLTESEERPESFDRPRRQQLGCDLTTLKRKIDDYLELRRERVRPGPDGG